MLITDEYRRLNADLHRSPAYGVRASGFGKVVGALAEANAIGSILDYGAGKGSLRRSLDPRWHDRLREYDPAIEAVSAEPDPADLLVSIDVLEHIEPDCLDAVLDHMRSKTLRIAYLTIACIPARKTLADGRNAHLIVEDYSWWLPRLWSRWQIRRVAIHTQWLEVVAKV